MTAISISHVALPASQIYGGDERRLGKVIQDGTYCDSGEQHLEFSGVTIDHFKLDARVASGRFGDGYERHTWTVTATAAPH